MIDLKRFLITVILLCSANFAYADSCIMIADSEIKDVKCNDTSIVCMRVLTTLTNEKRSIIVTSLKDGQTEFSVKVKSRYHCYKVKVCGSKLTICGDSTLKIMPVDLPAEALPLTPSSEECKD
ncbi:MAG: hypothetical protein LUB59_00290 [Candidatus Gastranaerophilales bacterium]|nr:hypothetical protein [Candidatus Gastranaerophilales bacterium]